MAADSYRYLGLAFATADLLIELDGDGRVGFAVGAGASLAGRDAQGLVGRYWDELFVEDDQPLAEAMILGLSDGERRGPVEMELAGGADETPGAAVSVFRMPQRSPYVSCALTLTGRRAARPAGGGLRERADFESFAADLIDAARTMGPDLELGLIEFAGLAEERKRLEPSDISALERRIAGALRAEAHRDAAAGLGGERFAVVRRKGVPAAAVARRLNRVVGGALQASVRSVPVDGAAGAGRVARALRHALDAFAADGSAPEGASLVEVLGQALHRTMAEAGAFGALVEDRRFHLVFQPVVSLRDGSTHHHEALVRFDADASPFAMIRMAEELDIIETLDCAVIEEVVKRLRADKTGKTRLAANVSGRTITRPSFMEAVDRLTRNARLTGRLMFEVTESAAIDNLTVAQSHVQALQARGFKVCLDDFGSGAASFAYLQQLSVDVVKIDGAYVRELTRSGRDDAMIRHLVSLCRELQVATVAEMVESREIEDALRQAGVDFAQGWLYGQPSAEPAAPLRPAPVAARRRGVVEQWG